MSRDRHVGILLASAIVGLATWNALASPKYGMPASRAPRGVLHPPHVALVSTDAATVHYTTVRATAGGIAFAPPGREPVTVASPEFGTSHQVRLQGLRPGQLYSYRVLVDGRPVGDSHAFTTDRGAGHPVRAVVIGDTGSGSARQIALAQRLEELTPELVLHTGDLAYPDGTRSEVLWRFAIPFANARAGIPFYATLGNHDVKTEGGAPFLDALVLPTNGFVADERTYVGVRGALRFVCIDTEQSLATGSPQHEWLDQVLSEGDPSRWTVVFGHRAVWPGSRSGGSAALQRDLVPLLDQHGVALYLSGHDHVYMRTHPMRGGKVMPEPASGQPTPGVVYVVSGGGGKSLYQVFDQPHNAVALKADHLVELTVDASTLTGRALGSDGATLDTFTLTR